MTFRRSSLDAPESWADGSVITLIAPEGASEVRPNVLVTREPAGGLDLAAAVVLADGSLTPQPASRRTCRTSRGSSTG